MKGLLPSKIVIIIRQPSRYGQFGGRLLGPPPPYGSRPGTRGRAQGNLVKPGAERIANPEPARFLDQDEESRLKSIQRSSGSASRARQTRKTIGPCRSTRTAKASSADSPRPVAYRSSNCPSVRSRITPTLKSVSNCRWTVPSILFATRLVLSPQKSRIVASNVSGASEGCNYS